MDVATRAEEITAHIVNPVKRERVRNNLTKFLKTLDEIPVYDEVTDEPLEELLYRDDGSDGVPPTTLEDLQGRELAKHQNLRDLHQDMRRNTGNHSSQVSVAICSHIDEIGRHGYTQLHKAVLAGDVDLVIDLKARGARRDITDNAGMTALERARNRVDDSPEMARIVAILES